MNEELNSDDDKIYKKILSLKRKEIKLESIQEEELKEEEVMNDEKIIENVQPLVDEDGFMTVTAKKGKKK